MKTLSRDTSVKAEQFLIEKLRLLPARVKAQQFQQLTRACQEIASAGIRRRYPSAAEEEIRMRLAALWLDREIMKKVFGWDVAREGL